MKAPGFWWEAKPGIAARLLQPAALAYGAVASRRMGRLGTRSSVPVVCIGNVTVGGSGKTPTAIWVAGMLRSLGHSPAFLTRGYGGRAAGPLAVDAAQHAFPEIGDEALLLARHAPTIVARDRPAGASLAASLGADVLVMDDGLQNPSLIKDLTLAVFDGAVGIGNGLVLPAGPLRAPVGTQWPHIYAVVVLGPGEAGEAMLAEAVSRNLPAFRARLAPDPRTAERLRGQRVLAFAGTGRPAKFFETLRSCGAEIVQERPFPDHHPFREDEIAALLAEAEAARLTLVTTEKDMVRLAGLRAAEPRIRDLVALPVTLSPDEPDELARFLSGRLAGASGPLPGKRHAEPLQDGFR